MASIACRHVLFQMFGVILSILIVIESSTDENEKSIPIDFDPKLGNARLCMSYDKNGSACNATFKAKVLEVWPADWKLENVSEPVCFKDYDGKKPLQPMFPPATNTTSPGLTTTTAKPQKTDDNYMADCIINATRLDPQTKQRGKITLQFNNLGANGTIFTFVTERK